MDIKNLFKDKSLLENALTHRSFLNESQETDSNERMEFLGDAVLEFLVSEKLYLEFDNQREGFLTALRSNLVNTVNLSKVAKRLGIGQMIKLSRGEEDGGGRDNQSLLADTMEAVIGALFLDQGIDVTKKFIEKYVFIDIEDKLKKPLKDPKSRFQEIMQAKGEPSPKYKVSNEIGPDHDKQFEVEVHVNSTVYAKGLGKNKALAEQNAAENALKHINIK